MEFKIGATCTGCERVIKNMKKMTGSIMKDSTEVKGVSDIDMDDYLNQMTKDTQKSSTQLVQKMKENSKVKKLKK